MVCFVCDICGINKWQQSVDKTRSMATKINPTKYNSAQSYELYKQELQAWKEITEIAKEKHGVAITLTLPEENV